MDKFKEVTISGSPRERGRMHGEALRKEIRLAIDYYQSIFNLSEREVLDRAKYFSDLIASFNNDYIEEIYGIAEGADIDPLWIVALNSRTEILSVNSAVTATECTAICFPKTSIIGQNWDWGRALEDITVVMQIEGPDHHIRMITEPGIIGKIGMNSAGIAVCLNILTIGEALGGLPIHVLLRAVLDCRSIESVRELVSKHAHGKASNILVCNDKGAALDIEFAGDKSYTFDGDKTYLLHTNHYLGEEINSDQQEAFFSSYARFNTATQLLSDLEQPSIDALKNIFSDRSNKELPIYRHYVPERVVKEVGTVCTIIMDLKTRELLIRKGNELTAGFSTYWI